MPQVKNFQPNLYGASKIKTQRWTFTNRKRSRQKKQKKKKILKKQEKNLNFLIFCVNFFYYLTYWAETFRVYAFFPKFWVDFEHFFESITVWNLFGPKVEKKENWVKPLVHMSWKFTWTILAPIYSIPIDPIFDITSKKKVMISQIFFWKKFLNFRRKKLFKKNPRILFLWFLDIV